MPFFKEMSTPSPMCSFLCFASLHQCRYLNDIALFRELSSRLHKSGMDRFTAALGVIGGNDLSNEVHDPVAVFEAGLL